MVFDVRLIKKYDSPESRTQILRTGILRAIHYTKEPKSNIIISNSGL